MMDYQSTDLMFLLDNSVLVMFFASQVDDKTLKV